MTTPGVPPWGCPWHGLVRDNQLTLPNGEVMTFPMQGGEWYQRGHTRLIRHPGAPADERTEAQIEADIALGRQWWREAIISAGTLHGRPLNYLRPWFYIDPAGRTWRVECDISLFSEAVEITLTRFGVLSGQPVTYRYTIPRPDLGQDEPVVDVLGLELALVDSTADGGKALMGFSGRLGPTPGQVFPFVPLGWVEVTLAGPGSDCQCAVRVVKTRAQALGAVAIEDHFEPGQSFTHGPIFDPVYGYEPNDLRSVFLYRTVAFEGSYDFMRRSVAGKVLAMFYSPAGELRELTLDLSSVRRSQVVERNANFGAAAFDGVLTNTSETMTTVRISLDEQPLFSESYTTTLAATQALSGDYLIGGSWTRVNQSNWGFPDGSTSTSGSGTTDWDWIVEPGATPPVTSVDFELALQLEPSGARIGPEPVYVGVSESVAIELQPAMHSLNLYSMTTRLPSDEGTRYLGVAATNGGIVSVPPLITQQRPIYGSACPVTGRVERDTVPICFT